MRMPTVYPFLFAFTWVASGCGDSLGPSTESLRSVTSALPSANGAIRTTATFQGYNDADIPLTCLDGEVTHWEGSYSGTITVVTPPSGGSQEQVTIIFGPDYFVERANGVRYYPIGPFIINEHHAFGPVTVIAGTASGAWRSADGDVLVLGFHVSFVFDKDGNPVLDKWTGACP